MANTAHVYRAKSGVWNMSFHHPIVREGSIGRKVHRSLKVATEAEARSLRERMNEILAIAEETPSLLPTRSVAAQRYPTVLVNAFFDCMTPEPVDYAAIRDEAMRLPPKRREGKSTPRILFAGTTGVGKSRGLQHLLQTTKENFPMRGAGRTTVSDIEVIVDDEPYGAVISFFSENEMREVVRENVIEACIFAHSETKDRGKIASKLMVDSDKKFRLHYVMGGWSKRPADVGPVDEEDDQNEVEAGEAAVWNNLDSYVERVLAMTDAALSAARRELYRSEEDEGVIEEYWAQYVDSDELDGVVEDILAELEKKLRDATGAVSWPVFHRVEDTHDRERFFAALRPFYDNHRSLFGRLVTPIVQGIRARGKFFPPEWTGMATPSWVLIDGQGVGHEQRNPSKIDRTVPPELTKKYGDADLICLFDRAVPAMTGDAPALLEDLIVRGFLDRLVVVFTHFEAAAAPDLDQAARRAKVLEGVGSAIQSIQSLPKLQKVSLEQSLDSRAIFLARLDSEEIKGKATQAEVRRLCERIVTSVTPLPLPAVRPSFNEYQIAEVVRRELVGFRSDWSEAELAGYHWKIMEALTNWVGNAYADGYPKRGLYPGQDLSRRLVAAVSRELESPKDWSPRIPAAEEQSRVLNAIRNRVGIGLDAYCREVIISELRVVEWLPAYMEIFGTGTKIRRARRVARMLQDRAQLPEEGLGRFTKGVWQIVLDAIDGVCTALQKSDDVKVPIIPDLA